MNKDTAYYGSEPNPVVEKSLLFAEKILKLCKVLFLQKEFIVSKQIGRSATSIGANIAEAERAQSKPDFYAKMKIAEKEANETAYWLKLLVRTGNISDTLYNELGNNLRELCSMLAAICKTTKENIEKEEKSKQKSI